MNKYCLQSVAVNILASFYLKSRCMHNGNPESKLTLFTILKNKKI